MSHWKKNEIESQCISWAHNCLGTNVLVCGRQINRLVACLVAWLASSKIDCFNKAANHASNWTDKINP